MAALMSLLRALGPVLQGLVGLLSLLYKAYEQRKQEKVREKVEADGNAALANSTGGVHHSCPPPDLLDTPANSTYIDDMGDER